jgi:hypothetical protein
MRPPFLGPIRLPANAFEEIEPIERDGKIIKRVRLKGTDLIGEQVDMNQTFEIGEIKPEPMPMPEGKIFFLDQQFPNFYDDEDKKP